MPTFVYGSPSIIRSFFVDLAFCFGMFFVGVGGSCMGWTALVVRGAVGISVKVVSVSGW